MMTRREFAAGSTSAVFEQAFAVRRTPEAEQNERPNVIWLFGDQHRAQALSCAGDPNARTPNIDNLAALGAHFSNAISGFPLCCPFRGSLLTGRYPHHVVPGHEYPLPPGQKTIAHVLHEAGYRTAYFGKWHVSGWKERNGRGAMFITDPAQRGGFETWAGYENNSSPWDSWVHGGQGKDAFHYRLPGYETDELTKLLIGDIRERGEERKKGAAKPFFAVLSVQPPHDPYVAPVEFMARYNPAQLQLRRNVPPVRRVEERSRREAAGYYAMIENWDFNIGRIRQALKETGLEWNTHLVFFSDHGDMHGSQGMFRKTNPFEESIRIPFIISGEIPRYEGRINSRPSALLNHVDIAPTTLGLCGIAKPNWMQGVDLSHHRFGKPGSDPDSAYLQLVIPSGHADSINVAYRGVLTREGWKYCCLVGQSWLMFNLNEDPYEQVNLAYHNGYRAERKKLADRLKQWVADTGDQFQVPDH